MWVLIITLWGSGTAITQVPGFSSEENCNIAATKYKKAVDIGDNYLKTVCVFANQLH